MARLYIPQQNEPEGPWLLGHESLEALNTLFNKIDTKLIDALAKTIENTARQQAEEDNQNIDLAKRIAKLQRKYSKNTKVAEITFADGNVYEANDVEGILNYVDTNPSLAPTELYIRSIHGNYENEFELIINTNAGKDEVDFEYRIRCIDEEIQQKIKTLIDKWIRENKSNQAQQIWSNVIVYPVWWIGALTIFLSWVSLTDIVTNTVDYESELKKQVHATIERGINSSNSDSALMLVLKLQSDYLPKNVKQETIEVPNETARKIFLATSILWLASLIRPQTIIGIGKKQNRLKLYKLWIKVIYGTLAVLGAAIVTDSFKYFINW